MNDRINYRTDVIYLNKLKELRNIKKLTTRELSEIVNINHSTITNIENGKTSFSDSYIKIFASFFNVSSDYLLGISDIKKQNKIVAEEIPVYSHIYGGNNILRDEHKLDSCSAPNTIDLHNCIYLSSQADLMTEKIFKDDLLLVKLDHAIENGLFVLAKKDQRGTVHRLLNTNGEWIFLEKNNFNKVSDYQLIGKVLMVSRVIE